MDESEVLKFEQPVRPLRLSEAIRIGAKIRPQLCSGGYKEDGKSCAFGAAAEVLGYWPPILHFRSIMIDRKYAKQYGRSIARHNDSGMTREAIADRLEEMGL